MSKRHPVIPQNRGFQVERRTVRTSCGVNFATSVRGFLYCASPGSEGDWRHSKLCDESSLQNILLILNRVYKISC